MPDCLYQDNRLGALELKLASFIHTYKGDRFYFSNEHLAEILNSSERSISRAISELTKKALIGVDYEIKAGGGKVRFIRSLIQIQLEGLATSGESDSPKVASRIYKEVKDNKLKDNKLKEIYKEKDLVSVSTEPLVSQSECQEIADRYGVPVSFVLSKLDDMSNWYESNPRKNKRSNWVATLRNFVKKDALSIRKEQSGKSKIAFIA